MKDVGVCTGTYEGNDFIWTENLIKHYGLYTMYRSRDKWCECVNCFKKRFIEAEKIVNKDLLKEEDDYNYAVCKLMKY